MTLGEIEDERVADRDLAAPHVGLERPGGQAALAMRVGQRRKACLADQIRLGRSDRRDVHLAAADDGDARRRSVRCRRAT